MQEYPIVVDLFTNAKCYKTTATCSRKGIQVHSVGCKGTKAARWKKSWNKPTATTCGGYVIDTDAITQCLKEGAKCWLSGSGDNGNANADYLGFEICEPTTKNDTAEAAADLYGKTLYLCTYLCRKYGINPANVRAHYELHALGLASNHADVRHWWGKKGTAWEPYTMDRLRADIAAELGVTPEYSTTIQKGASGDAVKALQKLLAAAGYSVDIDGSFGEQTEATVKAFQKDHKLAVDGVCGPKTWDAVYDVNEEAVTDSEADTIVAGDPEAEETTAKTTPDYSAMPMLRKGLRGENVKTLQTALNASGKAGKILTVDGAFGPLTDTAVRTFQKAKGLKADGIAGPKTWAALATA